MSFDFIRDGITYKVSTEVGNGPTKVVVQEEQKPSPDLEPSDEVANG